MNKDMSSETGYLAGLFGAPSSRSNNSVESLLVIEDNPGDVELIREMLASAQRDDIDLRTDSTLGEGLGTLQNFSPDLVLLDLGLPDAQGLEVLRHVVIQTAGKTPIIVLTGLDDEEVALEALHNGADDYLQKNGLTGGILLRSIRHAVERHRIAERLRESEGRFRAITEHASDLIFILDEDCRCTYISPSVRRYMNVESEDLLGSTLELFVHEEDWPGLLDSIERACHEPQVTHSFDDCRIQHVADGGWCYMVGTAVALPDVRGVEGVVLTCHDITERKQYEQTIEEQATIDKLTGLPNRTLFQDRLASTLSRSMRVEKGAALLFLDLDGFKDINDTLGHDAGDALLHEAAQRLQLCVRRTDTVARMGGDEFTIILADLSDELDPERVANKILASLAAPFDLNGEQRFVTGSIGVAIFSRDGADAETLIRNADTAMYQAKRAGKNQFRFFAEEMNQQISERTRIATELRRALERDEFKLVYHPVFDAKTEEIVQLEALIRWEHPELGLQMPVDFIPIAEESGLIDKIGTWAIDVACSQLGVWWRRGWTDLRVGVNVSPKHFHRPEFEETVNASAVTHSVSPDGLILEITENAFVRGDEENVHAVFRNLRKRGASIALDDFGTGYSSLSYLKRYPVDILKIDRIFVRDIMESDENLTLVRAIISMAHAMGLKVVGEGVETDAQFDTLNSLGCDLLQGYKFTEPLDSDEMTAFLDRSRQN